mmetsp:Transcript_18330/g.45510  ORF Transcript_18330/g.45510 Transcript_18330/m.45510 type:complete len:271 (+) Transcript_18330:727-1539(+)
MATLQIGNLNGIGLAGSSSSSSSSSSFPKFLGGIQLVAPEFEYPCLGLQLFAVPQLNESFGVSRGRRKFQSDSADGHFGKIKERVDHFRVDSAHVHASAATKFLCKGPCHANGFGKGKIVVRQKSHPVKAVRKSRRRQIDGLELASQAVRQRIFWKGNLVSLGLAFLVQHQQGPSQFFARNLGQGKMVESDLVGCREADGIEFCRNFRQEFVVGNLRELAEPGTARKDNNARRNRIVGGLEHPDKFLLRQNRSCLFVVVVVVVIVLLWKH